MNNDTVKITEQECEYIKALQFLKSGHEIVVKEIMRDRDEFNKEAMDYYIKEYNQCVLEYEYAMQELKEKYFGKEMVGFNVSLTFDTAELVLVKTVQPNNMRGCASCGTH